MVEALDIWVKGIVQGVGFRPFVYRLAKRCLINGWVLNAVDGVHIHAEGESQHLDEFVLELSENAPAAAQVTEIELHEVPLEQFDNFEIRFSDDESSAESTLVSPDLALCADCERELFSPADRRFRYPFINCTNCGPRFTIIDALPYDRANTSMRAFPMCAACRAEYEDPADRRFHAQPDACFECGPHLTWRAPGDAAPTVAATREASDELLTRASQLLVAGGILAVKGLGGYHLACDARNPEAVARLRQRKGRDGKAFALMMRTPADVRQLCTVSAEEEAILTGMERPIVLLRRRPDAPAPLPPEVAGPLPELGIMLPYTPVQHLLLHDFAALLADLPNGGPNGGGAPAGPDEAPALVMTSGNVHDEPIITDDDVAFRELAHIADGFLGNDREILTRFDDSVLRVLDFGPDAGQAVQFIRRARGYAPAPLRLPVLEVDVRKGCAKGTSQIAHSENETADVQKGRPKSHIGEASQHSLSFPMCDLERPFCTSEEPEAPVTFATGPEQKNTFTFLRGGQAFVSQHLGDVENAATFDAWLQTKARYQELFGLTPAALAADLHPEYLTTKWALEQAALTGDPLARVQHHHAHIVAAMAENGQRGPVCGIAFDGTGYGADGNLWGGEVLLANLHAFERFANFAYVPMPGGAAAIRHPLRTAYGVLWEADLLEHPGAAPALEALGPEQAELCGQMIERGLNTPVTSSVGRLFDAASALLGVCTEPTYEGEAAILLEACMATGGPEPAASAADSAHPAKGDRYAVGVIKNTAAEGDTAQTTSVVLLDAAPTFGALLDDAAAGVPVPVIARRFHDAMVGAVITAAQLARALYDITDVALTGGVFMNRYLTEHAVPQLAAEGFTVILNRELPPNDACVSLGQAVAAR